MLVLEYGAPGLVTHAGQILALPPATTGLPWIVVIPEQPAPVPLIWRSGASRIDLVQPDAYADGSLIADAAAVQATSLLVGFFVGRLRLVRLAPSEFAQLPLQFALPPAGATGTIGPVIPSPLPSGFLINRGA